MLQSLLQVRDGPPNVIAIIVSNKLIVANIGTPVDNGGDEEEAAVVVRDGGGGILPSREDDGDENGMMFAVLGCIVGGNFGAFVGVIENSTKRFVVSSICGRLLQSKYSGGCCDTMQDVCTIQSVKEEILEYTPGYRSSAHRIPLFGRNREGQSHT